MVVEIFATGQGLLRASPVVQEHQSWSIASVVFRRLLMANHIAEKPSLEA